MNFTLLMRHLSCRIKLQCTYPLAGLHRLFSKYKFESDTEGVGRIVRDGAHSTEGKCLPARAAVNKQKHNWSLLTVVQKPMEITAVLQTPVPATSRHTTPVLKPAHRPPIGYLMVPSLLKNLSKKGWCLNFFLFFIQTKCQLQDASAELFLSPPQELWELHKSKRILTDLEKCKMSVMFWLNWFAKTHPFCSF